MAKYLPRTICVIDTGADISMVMVWLRRSSAISRMVSKGTDISSTIEAMPNSGTTTISVRPGALGTRASCDWMVEEIIDTGQENPGEDELQKRQHHPGERRGEQ